MVINFGICKAAISGFCLLVGLSAFAQPRPWLSALDLSYKSGKPTLPVAAYKNISPAEFRSMVRKAFQESGFSLVSVEQEDKSTIISFNVTTELKTDFKPEILVYTDELLDGRKRCNPCFLRSVEIKNVTEIKALPWMTQYDLSTLLVPAIDKAHSTLEFSGRKYLDRSWGFRYERQWAGERNLFGNSFVGISLPSLKEIIVRAYRNAGFIPLQAVANSNGFDLDLTFNFPIDPPKDGGAIYRVKIRSEYDEDGNCYPCEVIENFDPHQQLPPAGLSGILSRATLESRFTTARDAAYEGLRIDLERYLRPRSVFSVPPKSGALGSPRPLPVPPPVT